MNMPEPTGMKFDTEKPRFDLLLGDMPLALEAVARVLTFGAAKYADGNWQHVENAERRYMAAGTRHELALAKGEQHDAETGEHHLAHKLCCDLFRLELALREKAQ
ncbi:dATP/dGTP diphosphohydrolase domain-containing protein [Vreelandella populi]|uniref:dATP/dGTP diphosphohydrolase domain-containing protein n=1 Tax=Vreelandella populi TaxID=2498858 RepID=UPI001C8CFF1B|nr:dATP/dGTP diphosphohydrolase domain-containing protein [Halomonas populi]